MADRTCKPSCRCRCNQQGCECWDGVVKPAWSVRDVFTSNA